MALGKDHLPGGIRNKAGEGTGNQKADQQLFAEHGQVGQGVAGCVRPSGWCAKLFGQAYRWFSC